MQTDFVERGPATPRSRRHPRCPTGSRLASLLFSIAALAGAATAQAPEAPPPFSLGAPTSVGEGIDLYRPDARALMDPAGPLVAFAMRVDLSRARLAVALANDATPSRQTVPDIAAAHRALAAINGSFFDSAGRQAGMTTVDGEAVTSTARARGAMAWSDDGPVLFDRVRTHLAIRRAGSGSGLLPIDHLNPTATRSGVSLFTKPFRLAIPGRSGRIADPAQAPMPSGAGPALPPPPTSAEPAAKDDPRAVSSRTHVWRWRLGGQPLQIQRQQQGGDEQWFARTGPVLMFRGTAAAPPAPLRDWRPGTRVELVRTCDTLLGTAPDAWCDAACAVSGAGLLVHEGRHLTDWSAEKLRAGFSTERHPRTMIGTDARGYIWLVVVDGRRPAVSTGMTFVELQRLADALGLVEALNLDGGGSTTMVVRGEVVNQPSDLIGARPVPDAIVVLPKRATAARSPQRR